MHHVGVNVVFLELILKLYDVCFIQNIFIAPNVRSVNNMFTLWSFDTLLYFV